MGDHYRLNRRNAVSDPFMLFPSFRDGVSFVLIRINVWVCFVFTLVVIYLSVRGFGDWITRLKSTVTKPMGLVRHFTGRNGDITASSNFR